MYDFADNPLKLRRAIAECGPEATDEAVKERYVALGGLLRAEEPVEEPVKKVVKKVAKKK